ncbi:helix-turn-helix transcriptional regulator [Antrihabitans cavernicola]|uniref:Helix-turn-helix domain-containing protein n=1 Tax=Antrihabitans cavernicola TaxID=2495913 RepID=A0A5A7S9K4_9NOCA|nr:helix-turn-helix transcriptional regulator [Spelaeibacter cavernicola]KAA0021263.1 helix-turn-helix domain-containing protein [Spelaeibacter cavernicola]
MDRAELAEFLRGRRASLVPADVGLPPGVRRRTPGLRRDEVALLAGMSTDYFTRLEQGRGPHPSTQIVASLARALRLTDNERDHLYFLAGHTPPPRSGGDKHVGPGLLHLLTKLDDTPACVMSDLGETLVQNAMHVVLFGDTSVLRGLDRYIAWRWFTGVDSDLKFPSEDRDRMSRKQIADLRAAAARRSYDPEVTRLVTALRANSPEFEALWREHIVEVESSTEKRFVHPEVGMVAVNCEVLVTQKQEQNLLVYFPLPGTDAREKLELLRVIGTQALR